MKRTRDGAGVAMLAFALLFGEGVDQAYAETPGVPVVRVRDASQLFGQGFKIVDYANGRTKIEHSGAGIDPKRQTSDHARQKAELRDALEQKRRKLAVVDDFLNKSCIECARREASQRKKQSLIDVGGGLLKAGKGVLDAAVSIVGNAWGPAGKEAIGGTYAGAQAVGKLLLGDDEGARNELAKHLVGEAVPALGDVIGFAEQGAAISDGIGEIKDAWRESDSRAKEADRFVDQEIEAQERFRKKQSDLRSEVMDMERELLGMDQPEDAWVTSENDGSFDLASEDERPGEFGSDTQATGEAAFEPQPWEDYEDFENFDRNENFDSEPGYEDWRDRDSSLNHDSFGEDGEYLGEDAFDSFADDLNFPSDGEADYSDDLSFPDSSDGDQDGSSDYNDSRVDDVAPGFDWIPDSEAPNQGVESIDFDSKTMKFHDIEAYERFQDSGVEVIRFGESDSDPASEWRHLVGTGSSSKRELDRAGDQSATGPNAAALQELDAAWETVMDDLEKNWDRMLSDLKSTKWSDVENDFRLENDLGPAPLDDWGKALVSREQKRRLHVSQRTQRAIHDQQRAAAKARRDSERFVRETNVQQMDMAAVQRWLNQGQAIAQGARNMTSDELGSRAAHWFRSAPAGISPSLKEWGANLWNQSGR